MINLLLFYKNSSALSKAAVEAEIHLLCFVSAGRSPLCTTIQFKHSSIYDANKKINHRARILKIACDYLPAPWLYQKEITHSHRIQMTQSKSVGCSTINVRMSSDF